MLVLGATGQLGSDVVDAFGLAGWDELGLGHFDVDVTDSPALLAAVSTAHPSLVVNTAAFHHLDRCEEDQPSAYAVNAMGARNVAPAADDTAAALIHVSTDYVFDGAKGSPYEELDLPGPLNVYGASKLAGQHLVQTPAYSILTHRRLQEFDTLVMRPWQEALAEYIASLTEVEPGEPMDHNQQTGLGPPRGSERVGVVRHLT